MLFEFGIDAELELRNQCQPSHEVTTAISELGNEYIEQGFGLIDQEYKFPVFDEFDDDATKSGMDLLICINKMRGSQVQTKSSATTRKGAIYVRGFRTRYSKIKSPNDFSIYSK